MKDAPHLSSTVCAFRKTQQVVLIVSTKALLIVLAGLYAPACPYFRGRVLRGHDRKLVATNSNLAIDIDQIFMRYLRQRKKSCVALPRNNTCVQAYYMLQFFLASVYYNPVTPTAKMCSKEERPCILLVEDDRLTRTVLRHDLKLHGFEGA